MLTNEWTDRPSTDAEITTFLEWIATHFGAQCYTDDNDVCDPERDKLMPDNATDDEYVSQTMARLYRGREPGTVYVEYYDTKWTVTHTAVIPGWGGRITFPRASNQ
jgi:hypothetical protein